MEEEKTHGDDVLDVEGAGGQKRDRPLEQNPRIEVAQRSAPREGIEGPRGNVVE